MADLTAFCERVRGRLDEASFDDRQAILQLVVERIIVHEGSLEIRHVIPLHSPPPGAGGTPRGGWSIAFGSCGRRTRPRKCPSG